MCVRSDSGVKPSVRYSLLPLCAAACIAAGLGIATTHAADRPGLPPPAATQPVIDANLANRIQTSIALARDCLSKKVGQLQTDEHGDFSKLEISLSAGSGTALVLSALSKSGADYAKDPGMQAAFDWLVDHKYDSVPCISHRVLALCAVKNRPAKLQKCLEADTRWLLEAASQEGFYDLRSVAGGHLRRNENAYSDWATQALDAADKQGAHIPQAFWLRMLKVWWASRLPNGGWGYYVPFHPNDPLDPMPANFSMTAAGICGMKTCLDHLDKPTLASPEVSGMAKGLDQEIAWLDARIQLPMDPKGVQVLDGALTPGLDNWDNTRELKAQTVIELVQLWRVTDKKVWGKLDAYPVLAMQLLRYQNVDPRGPGRGDGGWIARGTSDPAATANSLHLLVSR